MGPHNHIYEDDGFNLAENEFNIIYNIQNIHKVF